MYVRKKKYFQPIPVVRSVVRINGLRLDIDISVEGENYKWLEEEEIKRDIFLKRLEEKIVKDLDELDL